tara:strand:+ start:461 stop:727 length:267 start_codon:yes stop_codon:yes gene_type:complete
VEIKAYELGEILELGLDGCYVRSSSNIMVGWIMEDRVVYRDDYEVEGWTGSWSAEELIQLVCRTSNGQVTEKEVRNLFGEAHNEERND